MRKGVLVVKDGGIPFIEDEKTEELFRFFDIVQSEYVKKYVLRETTEAKKPFLFYTIDSHVENRKEAIVLAKDANMMSFAGKIADIANEYGKYVASQKASGEGAKEFSDWYFDVSI